MAWRAEVPPLLVKGCFFSKGMYLRQQGWHHCYGVITPLHNHNGYQNIGKSNDIYIYHTNVLLFWYDIVNLIIWFYLFIFNKKII